MNFDTTKNSLEKTIISSNATVALKQAQGRNRLLGFDSLKEIVTHLKNTGGSSPKESGVIVRDLIAELQRNEHPCWSAALLLSFFNCILRLNRQIGRIPSLDIDEQEQLLITTFLETAADFPLDSQGEFAALNLPMNYRKRVFAIAAEHNIEAKYFSSTNDINELDFGLAPSPEDAALEREERDERARQVAQFLEQLGDAEQDFIKAYFGLDRERRSLAAAIRERYPNADDDEIEKMHLTARQQAHRLQRFLSRNSVTLADQNCFMDMEGSND